MTLVTFYRIVVCASAPSDVETMRETVARILDDVLAAKLAEIEGAVRVLIEQQIADALSPGPARVPLRYRLGPQRWRGRRCDAEPR
jgi:hypothetical protein